MMTMKEDSQLPHVIGRLVITPNYNRQNRRCLLPSIIPNTPSASAYPYPHPRSPTPRTPSPIKQQPPWTKQRTQSLPQQHTAPSTNPPDHYHHRHHRHQPHQLTYETRQASDTSAAQPCTADPPRSSPPGSPRTRAASPPSTPPRSYSCSSAREPR